MKIIYVALLSVAFVITVFFCFYAYSWLGSIGNPLNAQAGFEYHISLAWYVIWFSAAVLLVLANILLWQTRSSWAMWTTFTYFALFIILRYFVLENAFFSFQQTNNLIDRNFSFSPLLGVVFVFLGAVIVYFNQFLSLRLRDKIFAKEIPEKDLPEKDLSEEI